MATTCRRREERQTQTITIGSSRLFGTAVEAATRYFRRGKTVIALLSLLALTLCVSARPNDKRIEDALRKIDGLIAQGPFRASWDSLEAYKVPNWYLDAKFGIFIHWGAFAVSAYDDWYARNMYLQDHHVFKYHVATYGPQSQFGYKDFIPMFKAENFDPDHWAGLFRKAGAKYVVPVAEHHDGFPMYDCSFTEWCAAKMGPQRDIVGELALAVRRQGLHFGASSHRAEHWWFFNGGMTFDSDVRDPRYAGLYGPAQPEQSQPDKAFLDDWLARTCEIVDRCEPELVWFDWWIEQPAFRPYLQTFAAYYYNRAAQWKRGVVINYKNYAYPERAAVLDLERGQLTSIRPLVWQTDTSVSKNSWFYKRDPDHKSLDSLIDDLVDIVSKNGVLLLNIGPKADGTIPAQEEDILVGIGQWLAVNGEAIYGTRPWKVFGEGPTEVVGGSFKDTARKPFTPQDIRFTAKGDTLYAIALAWPGNGRLTVKSLAAGSPFAKREIKTIQMLGSKATLKWRRNIDGLTIELPARKPCEYAFAFKISPVDRASRPDESLTVGKN